MSLLRRGTQRSASGKKFSIYKNKTPCKEFTSDVFFPLQQGNFVCTELDCGKHFKLKASLERHKRVVHADGVAHDCPVCGTRCADKGTLARHMYTHTGLKPYSCNMCSTMFTRKYHLDRHLKQTGCDGKLLDVFSTERFSKSFNVFE